MKKIYFLLISALFSYDVTQAQTASWTNQTTGTVTDLRGVYPVTADICYIAGYTGKIFKTTNGGTTWTALTSGVTDDLYSVCFTSLSTGYVVGDNGKALKTTDGGATWAVMTTGTTFALRHVSFISPTVGFIFGGKPSPSPNGYILKTTDGGATWTGMVKGTIGIYASSFVSATTGFCSNYFGTIYKTTDAGVSWNALTSGSSANLQGMYSPTPALTLVCGSSGTILKTTNTGTSWSSVSSGTTNILASMDFYDVNNGFIVGGSLTTPFAPEILNTTDGGSTWSSYTPTGYRLNRVDMFNANVGYAVGINGTILKYNSNVGIEEYDASSFVFTAKPNPFNTSTVINCGGYLFKSLPQIQLYDVTGKIVLTSLVLYNNGFEIEKAGLQNGLYFYVVSDGDQKINSGKLIIQ